MRFPKGHCKLCERKDRQAIDTAIVSDLPLRVIAEKFGVAISTVTRHRGHIRSAVEKVAKSVERREERAVSRLAERVEAMTQDSEKLYQIVSDTAMDAKEDGNLGAVVALSNTAGGIMRERRANYQFLGELTGEYQPGGTAMNRNAPSNLTIQLAIAAPHTGGHRVLDVSGSPLAIAGQVRQSRDSHETGETGNLEVLDAELVVGEDILHESGPAADDSSPEESGQLRLF